MPNRSFRRFLDGSDQTGRGPVYRVSESDLRSLLAEAISTIRVDATWYIATYPDIGEAIKNGAAASAEAHYVSFGFFEGRQPFQILVNEDWYLNRYADVAEAVSLGKFADAQSHFDRIGFEEGRAPFEDFKLFGSQDAKDDGI